jgi:hypothetical protein
MARTSARSKPKSAEGIGKSEWGDFGEDGNGPLSFGPFGGAAGNQSFPQLSLFFIFVPL